MGLGIPIGSPPPPTNPRLPGPNWGAHGTNAPQFPATPTPIAPQSPYGREGSYRNMPATGPMFPIANTNGVWALTPEQKIATNPIGRQIGSWYESSQAAIDQQYAADKAYNKSMGFLNQNQLLDQTRFAQKNTDLSKKALDIGKFQDVGLAGQRAQQAYDTAKTSFAQDMARINGMAGLTDAERAEKIRAARTTYGDIVAKLQANYAFNTADLQAAAGRDQRGALSSATARGAVGSKGYGDMRTDISSQLSSNLNRESSNLQLGRTGAQSDLTASNNATDLAYRNNQIQLQTARDNAAAAERQAALDKANSDKYLASVAADYGIRQSQADEALKQGLSALGYDSAATTAALIQAQKSSDAQAAAQAQALTAQALWYGMQAKVTPVLSKPAAPKPAPRYGPQ